MYHNVISLLVVISLLGCSPEFNWRETHIDNYSILFPNKPSTEQKKIFIDGKQYILTMQSAQPNGSDGKKILFGVAYINSNGYAYNIGLQKKLQKHWCEKVVINEYKIKDVFECKFKNKVIYAKWIVTKYRVYQVTSIKHSSYLNINLKENIELFFNSFKYLQ